MRTIAASAGILCGEQDRDCSRCCNNIAHTRKSEIHLTPESRGFRCVARPHRQITSCALLPAPCDPSLSLGQAARGLLASFERRAASCATRATQQNNRGNNLGRVASRCGRSGKESAAVRPQRNDRERAGERNSIENELTTERRRRRRPDEVFVFSSSIS